MTTLKETVRSILDRWDSSEYAASDLFEELRAALKQPEQEQHQPWCDSVTKLLLSNPPQIPPCNCKKEPVTQPAQEPECPKCKAAVLYECVACSNNNYPPQRKPLTDEDIEQAQRAVWRSLPSDFDYTTSSWIEIGIRYAEAAHGIKGEA